MGDGMNTLTYAITPDGIVYSRLGEYMAFPVIDFAEFGKDGDFTGPMPYHMEKCKIHELGTSHFTLEYTKKIPVSIKNEHRAFWGMKPLREVAQRETQTRR